MKTSSLRAFMTVASLSVLALSGCSAADQSTNAGDSSASVSASSEGALSISQPWIKAAENGMTAAFGTVTNNSDQPVKITGATTDISDDVQLHVTEIDPNTGTSQMKEATDGFTIEPGASHELAPGGDHIMLMNVGCSLKTGNNAEITVKLEDGSSQTFTFEVRDYQGAQEKYAPGESASATATESAEHSDQEMGDMENMDHSSMDHSAMSHSASASESALPECHSH